MSFQKILAISGKPGLYELKVQTRSGFVAESLLDGKKITVGLRSNVSLLTEIAVFTYNEEVKLIDIFKSIATKENGEATISHKEADDKLKSYFREILPEYDEDRVYTSDIKKIFQWYNLLLSSGDLMPSEEETTNLESSEENQMIKESKKKSKTDKKETAKSPVKVNKSVSSDKAKVTKSAAPKKTATTKTGSSRGK